MLAALALVDGLQSEERDVLLRISAGLGLERGVAGAIVDEIAAGGRVTNLQPPEDPRERARLFNDLVRLVQADGQVSSRERGVLERLARPFGVSADELTAILSGAVVVPPPVAGAVPVAAAVPPPVPTPAAAPSTAMRLQKPKRKSGRPKRQSKPGAADCPSCGAAIEFKNTRSVAVVCEYCDTTVARTDASSALEDVGKVSHLVADASPIQVGAAGTCFGQGFSVLGRLQLEHSTGVWNEWFLQWADGGTGWLGEALGQYFVTFPTGGDPKKKMKVPKAEDIEVGRHLQIEGKRYRVTDMRVARATGTEGETPFAIGEGYELPYADLRRGDAGFATIDYSEEPPLVFVGRCVGWRDLSMRGYRRFDGWRT